jgi:hypothetical protein
MRPRALSARRKPVNHRRDRKFFDKPRQPVRAMAPTSSRPCAPSGRLLLATLSASTKQRLDFRLCAPSSGSDATPLPQAERVAAKLEGTGKREWRTSGGGPPNSSAQSDGSYSRTFRAAGSPDSSLPSRRALTCQAPGRRAATQLARERTGPSPCFNKKRKPTSGPKRNRRAVQAWWRGRGEGAPTVRIPASPVSH